MLRNFFVGFAALVVVALAIPVLLVVFKLSLIFAIPIAIVIGCFFGIALIGATVRKLRSLTKKTEAPRLKPPSTS